MNYQIDGFMIEGAPDFANAKNVADLAPDGATRAVVDADGDMLSVAYYFGKGKNIPFERIRRITGYLVGTLDRFNDGKRAEERERVKHDIAYAMVDDGR